MLLTEGYESKPFIVPELAFPTNEGLLAEFKTIPVEKRLQIPAELLKYELPIVHEVGHAVVALSLGRRVTGYFFGEISWWEKTERKFVGDAGGVLWDSAGLLKGGDVAKLIACGGVVAELLYYGQIESTNIQHPLIEISDQLAILKSYKG
ncbi:MAG TPA: hypothetical protein ENN92_01690 [candidate division WWE3 bacterium]|uniref:Peptidase M41 domain-containing protein n=1 Tax=candidate division WWE3 bacterium TaxID=2053526 RepID=A0A7C1HX64_UNCKA|nr:hypothetical protein [candidate division WWE3 bacterium]